MRHYRKIIRCTNTFVTRIRLRSFLVAIAAIASLIIPLQIFSQEMPKSNAKTEVKTDIALREKIDNLIKKLGQMNYKSGWEAFEELKKIGQPATDVLIENLKNDDIKMRLSSVLALGAMREQSAVPILCELLQDTNARIRLESVQSLKMIGDPSALPALRNFLKDISKNKTATMSDEDEYTLIEAASALGMWEDKSGIPILIKILKDKEGRLRTNAACRLSEIGDISTVPTILKVINEGNPEVKNLFSALGQIYLRNKIEWEANTEIKEQVCETMVKTLKSDLPSFRKSAAIVLGTIGAKSSIPYLKEALNDSDRKVQASAAIALAKLRNTTGVPLLISLLQDDSYGHEAARNLGILREKTAVPVLVEVLKSDDEVLRSNAARALGLIGDRDALEPLEECLRTAKKGYTKRAIEKAIERIKEQ